MMKTRKKEEVERSKEKRKKKSSWKGTKKEEGSHCSLGGSLWVCAHTTWTTFSDNY